jgi:hypothetical protein
VHNHVSILPLFQAKLASAHHAHQTHIQILKERIQARRLNFWLKKPDVSTVKKTPNDTRVWSLHRGYHCHLLSLPPKWWSQSGSNRRHPACKAGALPAELWPQFNIPQRLMVGLTRLELVTPRLSSVCSNQLSYRPVVQARSSTDLLYSSSDNLLWILAARFS